MKYSVRSLMIVVTLAAVAAGAVGACRGHRQFCRERSNFHYDIAAKSTEELYNYRFPDGEQERWKAKIDSHCRLGEIYDHAIWRPWERLWIDDREAPSYPPPTP